VSSCSSTQLNIKTDILLKLLIYFFTVIFSPFLGGGAGCLYHVISLIRCHQLLLMIKYHVFFVPHVLYITSNLVKTKFLFSHSNVSSWNITALKKGINVPLMIFLRIVSIGVSFFEFVPYYTIVHSNNDICSHFPTNINFPSSTPNDPSITEDIFLTSLRYFNVIRNLLIF